MMKRKADEIDPPASNGQNKRLATEGGGGVSRHFNENLFASDAVQRYAEDYATSRPYKHAVVSDLVDDALLRSVRTEITENIVFTVKETDIYKIHQSGDLANLDGLSETALKQLPSLVLLRDALYSHDFRQWLSTVTGAGLLSGKKTDMAVNLYPPGCHLLCHDDVIGSRRLSYILYLTDPDVPWQSEWGGALRLYPTQKYTDESGKVCKIPSAEWSAAIPPAWNQLSFFAVQPGQSFHDVEEVYHRAGQEGANADAGRLRMAISGWFHIPQEGEEGYEPGLEEALAEKSSLQQLQSREDDFDEPQISWHNPERWQSDAEQHDAGETAVELSESDLNFLIQYLTPNYLTPDTVEELNDLFTEESMVQLTDFLNPKFAERLKKWLQDEQVTIWEASEFSTSRPPHKHRYRYSYSQPRTAEASYTNTNTQDNPLELVLDKLLPSLAFRKWLSLVTGLTLKSCAVIARRFRRGLDYELANAYDGEHPQLEYCLCITPSSGWSNDDEGEAEDEASKDKSGQDQDARGEGDNVGGYELYMAGEDPEDDEAPEDGVTIPPKMQSQTGAGERRNASRKKADPAVYKAAADDEDDGIIASNPASWNTLNIVLRDRGTLRFVKYVSQSAPGDRWDFAGRVEVEPDDEDSIDDEGGAVAGAS